MPIYEYICKKCGKEIEVIQKVNDPPPECHGEMKKLISNTSFRLLGKGWYETDYGKKKQGPSKPKKS